MNNLNSLVSIITPTYNRAGFIGEAIKSVLAQSYPHFELIVVDDGSVDDTRAIIEAFGDERIRYFYQENQGQSVARNLGLGEASGAFICFLDSDNVWFPDKLEKSLEVLQARPEVDIVYGDCVTIDEQGREISRKNMRRHSGRIAHLMLKDNFVSMNTTMTRRRCFDEMGGFSGRRRVADDYDLWLKFSARYQFCYIPEYMAYYRVMDDQISSDKVNRFRTNEAIVRDFLRDYPEAVSAKEAREGLSAFYLRKARHFASVRNRAESFPAIFYALRYTPFSLAAWKGLVRVLLP